MKNLFNRFLSAALALTLVAGVSGVSTVSAAEESLANGSYDAGIHFYKSTDSTSLSMCDSIFAHEADVTLTDDSATLTFYVAYPIPAFSTMGTDGTIKDVTVSYDGATYTAASDITTQPSKTFDTTGALFGINAGDSLTTQVISVDLPREAVDTFDEGLNVSAYVNVVMMSTQQFIVKVTDLSANSTTEDTKTEDTTTEATETTTKEVEVSANVAAPAATYEVTIPETVTLGTLSAEEDNSFDFEVAVEAQNLGTGYVEVVSSEEGTLTSGENTLAFTNSFGTQKTSDNATLTGSFTVKAADVKAAAAGDYTGTVNFNINYYAAN